jgi:hypothetical protein
MSLSTSSSSSGLAGLTLTAILFEKNIKERPIIKSIVFRITLTILRAVYNSMKPKTFSDLD